MATATKKVVEVPQPPVKEGRILLELTDREARALQLVLHRIGGKPDGIRGVMDGISSALRAVGYRSLGYDTSLRYIKAGMLCTDEEYD